MAHYRKIDVRMWGDEKFRALTPMPPSGQSVWLWLLTNPATTNIPGCYSIGEAGAAEMLGWSLKAFREAFREACFQGMVKADWKARFVYVPRAVNYNKPESPNVVLSWRAPWDNLPECDLKVQSWQGLKAFLEGLGEGYVKAFAEACPKPMSNQEQEQEQEQDIIPPIAPQEGARESKAKKSPFIPPTREEVRDYIAANPELSNVDPETFWKGFNDGDWIDTQGKPVRNWKLKLRTWSSHAPAKAKQETPQQTYDRLQRKGLIYDVK